VRRGEVVARLLWLVGCMAWGGVLLVVGLLLLLPLSWPLHSIRAHGFYCLQNVHAFPPPPPTTTYTKISQGRGHPGPACL
jgi:hypothetical protein